MSKEQIKGRRGRREGQAAIDDPPKTNGQSSAAGPEDRAGQNPPSVRYASKEQFNKAHRKTSSLHAGLFRRLAE